jgi:hypothetical protein
MFLMMMYNDIAVALSLSACPPFFLVKPFHLFFIQVSAENTPVFTIFFK